MVEIPPPAPEPPHRDMSISHNITDAVSETEVKPVQTACTLPVDVERRLIERIETLESGLEKPRKSVQQDRKLLKKALLVQLQLDDEDDD